MSFARLHYSACGISDGWARAVWGFGSGHTPAAAEAAARNDALQFWTENVDRPGEIRYQYQYATAAAYRAAMDGTRSSPTLGPLVAFARVYASNHHDVARRLYLDVDPEALDGAGRLSCELDGLPGVPPSVWFGRVRRFVMPITRAREANALMGSAEVQALAARIIAGYSQLWVDTDNTGRLNDDATTAEEELRRLCAVSNI